MIWKRGNSSNGSTIYEPLSKRVDSLMIARYRRKRGHLAEPSYNFANSPYPFVLISGWVCAVATPGRS
jgi:hypothetical protein